MEKIKKFQNRVAQISLAMSAVALATVGAAIFTNVLCRYVFKIGLMWVEQYARYMIIWSVFLASNVLIYNNELMRVDFMDGIWPTRMKQIREIIYTILFIIMLGTLCRQGWVQARDYMGVSLMGIPIDKFWVYLAVPAGAVIMMIQYVLNLIVAFFNWKGGQNTK